MLSGSQKPNVRSRSVLLAAAIAGCTANARPAISPPPVCSGAHLVAIEALDARRGCTEIAGDVLIDGAAIADLSALGSVRRIRGSLSIGPTIQLGSLAGLAALEQVDGDLEIRSNQGLTGVFLGELRAVGGDLAIEHNPQAAIASLHRLEQVGGSAAITANGSLLRLDLSRLARVGSGLEIEDNGELDDVALDPAMKIGR